MILIAIPGYLYRKGLEVIVREQNAQVKIHSVSTSEGLNSFLKSAKPSLIFAYSDFISIVKPYIQMNDGVQLVRVLNEKPEALSNESFQTDVLYITDEESSVLKKVKRNIALTKKRNIHENQDSGLSEREQDVIREIALGKTNKEIADDLFISAHTVITHRKNITRKLGIKTVSGLTVYAILNKIIQMEEI